MRLNYPHQISTGTKMKMCHPLGAQHWKCITGSKIKLFLQQIIIPKTL